MIVRCPQCQYANQIEANATKPRIICARCATVISIEFLSSPSVPPVSDLAAYEVPAPDLFAEGRHSESLFMKTPESPLDLDSLLEPPNEAAPVQPFAPPPPIVEPVISAISPAIESRWDADEILDIPRATAAEPQLDPLSVEDLLSPTSYDTPYDTPYDTDATASYGESLLDEPEPFADLATATATGGEWGSSIDNPAEFFAEPIAPFDVSQQGQFPEANYADTVPEITHEQAPERPSVFAQDSYTRNTATYVMATPDSNNKGRLAKIFLATALGFALLGIGYYALSGLIKDWLGTRQSQQATLTPGSGTAGAPSLAPSVGVKAGTENGKNASANSNTTASVAASAKPSASANATATPVPTASKATPTPAPPQAGTSGHSVGAGEGSLTIQLGAYKSSGEAQARVSKLKTAGIEGRVVKAEVPGKGTWYRVQSGRFTNEAEASKHAGELRAKGVAQDFIVTGYQNQ